MSMKENLKNINLTFLLLFNFVFTLIFMNIVSLNCPDNYSGIECVHNNDNLLFFIQVILNLVFPIFYLIKIEKLKWKIFLINIILLPMIYIVMAFFHSISHCGL
jgi:hypothetical protein